MNNILGRLLIYNTNKCDLKQYGLNLNNYYYNSIFYEKQYQMILQN